MRRFVRRVRWTRVTLVALAALALFVTFRLWQWWRYAKRQAARADASTEQLDAERTELERLNKELKDVRTLVHGKPDEIVTYTHMSTAPLPDADERIRQILQGDRDARPSNREVRALWDELTEAQRSALRTPIEEHPARR